MGERLLSKLDRRPLRFDSSTSNSKMSSELGKDYISTSSDPKNIQDLTQYIQNLLQQMQDKFQNMSDQIIGRIDDMGHRIDDLERNIADLMSQAGMEDGQ